MRFNSAGSLCEEILHGGGSDGFQRVPWSNPSHLGRDVPQPKTGGPASGLSLVWWWGATRHKPVGVASRRVGAVYGTEGCRRRSWEVFYLQQVQVEVLGGCALRPLGGRECWKLGGGSRERANTYRDGFWLL